MPKLESWTVWQVSLRTAATCRVARAELTSVTASLVLPPDAAKYSSRPQYLKTFIDFLKFQRRCHDRKPPAEIPPVTLHTAQTSHLMQTASTVLHTKIQLKYGAP
ncbi:hypothetical protein FIBSPDRAFT_1044722 [Athelia psychrophila]|uniref:Uncharacterized protein n=1 Tax=Athelia psychrophila TaxID=1759441 RepID=A0A166JBJ4_9AGAM|nr:hypothetical protein FIBSPDRAFT_1044718 [Fibularhizoctonia sp. CBS 109695]KZP20695.1 hypothetical protein FIBSPDRAFT_1044722 [Fibularhizoctonia sp. CBS 109695]